MPFVNVFVKTRHNERARLLILIVKRDRTCEEVSSMPVLTVPLNVEVHMEEVGSLARVGVFGNIRIGNKTMVMIGTGSERKSIPYEVLTHELLNYTEEHVAEPTEPLFP